MRKLAIAGVTASVCVLVAGAVVTEIGAADAVTSTTDEGATYCPITPTRVLNTTFGSNQVGTFSLASLLPPSMVAADLNVTHLGATANTFETFFAPPGRVPTVSDVPATNQVSSNVNDATDTTSFTVPLGSTDSSTSDVVAWYNHVGTVRVLVDVSGYYTTSTCQGVVSPPVTTTQEPTSSAAPPPTTTVAPPPSTTSAPPPTTSTAPAAGPADWPTPDDTGATGTLTDVTPPTGELIAGDNNQVVSNERIHGTLTITGCNVTVRNVEVDAGIALSNPVNDTPDVFAIWNKSPDDRATDCVLTLDHVSVITPAGKYATEAVRDAFGQPQHITALKAIGQQLGITVGGGDDIESSYIELAPTLRGDHNEAILDDGTTGLTIKHNTFLNPNGQTSALSLFTEFGSNHDILVQDNLLAGGGFTCYCGDGATDNAGNPAPADNVSFINNVFWRKYFPTVGAFAPGRAYRASNGGQWTGNVFMEQDGTLTTNLVPQPPVDG